MAQKILAEEIITDIHGRDEFLHAKSISEALFTGNIKDLTEKEILIAFRGVPEVSYEEKKILDFLVDSQIMSSKREAREFLENRAISVNGEIIQDENFILENKTVNIIRKGKKKYYLVKKS